MRVRNARRDSPSAVFSASRPIRSNMLNLLCVRMRLGTIRLNRSFLVRFRRVVVGFRPIPTAFQYKANLFFAVHDTPFSSIRNANGVAMTSYRLETAHFS
jgi:hypothetical protein